MRLPVIVILILIWVEDLVRSQRHAPRVLDAPALIKRLGLRRSAEQRDVQSEELHELQLCGAGLVAQERSDVLDAVHHARDHGHRDDGGAGAVFNDRFGPLVDAVFQHIHG